ncbi:hypothetical protein [Kribbella sp. NPDC048928]|uniref:hypothetical protein n=1 Tax=Kribbella sp. NPDC048928 TaxID=3364111 RepID=UPI003711B28E
MSSRITPPNADTGRGGGRRWTLTLSALVLLVIVGCVLFLLANRGKNNDTTSPPASTPQQSTGPSTGPSGAPSTGQSSPGGPATCSLPAGSQQVPNTPIHGASWSLVNQVAVPGADAYGPQVSDSDGLRRCFAHSPVGAVFAVYNHIAAMSIPNDSTGAKTFPILRRIMVPGKNLNSYIEWLKTAPDSGDGTGVQLAGFKVLDATADRVTLLVAAQAGAGYASSTWTMVWQGGDWKVEPPQAGEMAGAPFSPLQDLTGFVPWRGA